LKKWLDRLDSHNNFRVRNFVIKVENGKAADIAKRADTTAGGPPALRPPRSAAQGLFRARRSSAAGSGRWRLFVRRGLGGSARRPRIYASFRRHQQFRSSSIHRAEFEQICRRLKDLDIIPRQVMIEARFMKWTSPAESVGGVSAFVTK